MDRRNYVGVGASLNVTNDLYLAVTYQSIQYDIADNQDSLDVAASYSFGGGYTLTAGIFTYDDDDFDVDYANGVDTPAPISAIISR